MKRQRSNDDKKVELISSNYVEERLLLRMCSPGDEDTSERRPAKTVTLEQFAKHIAANEEAAFLEERVRFLAGERLSFLPRVFCLLFDMHLDNRQNGQRSSR